MSNSYKFQNLTGNSFSVLELLKANKMVMAVTDVNLTKNQLQVKTINPQGESVAISFDDSELVRSVKVGQQVIVYLKDGYVEV